MYFLRLFSFVAFLLVFGVFQVSYADEVVEPVHHYEGHFVASSEDALRYLDDYSGQIGVISDKKTLAAGDLERIHELTYTLENAVDYLSAHKAAAQEKLDAVDEAIQAVHHASENHKEAEVRAWIEPLLSAVAGLKGDGAAESNVAVDPNKTQYDIVIKDHKFSPETLHVPAGKKIRLIVDNQDPTPEEFESHDMNREKIIGGGKKATIFVGPLKPGQYHYFGEFNEDSAQGYIIAE
ncbi:MAG: cupredoxin domain-containing protein [Alphaproteobacteria bacterium]|nr:cupredoxin domain-containing protein [Alphaproteobacteria bacterium]